jgi:CBS domain-containing protein
MSDREHQESKAFELLTAADVMTRSPRTCSMFSSVLEAVLIFRESDCGAVPVLAEGKPAGILTDRDVALAVGDYPDLATQPVSAVVHPGVITVGVLDRLAEVCQVLRREAVRRVLVLGASGDVVGIIGWADIAPVLSDRLMGQIVKDVVSAPA